MIVHGVDDLYKIRQTTNKEQNHYCMLYVVMKISVALQEIKNEAEVFN